MQAQATTQDRKTRVLNAIYNALIRAPAASIRELYFEANRYFEWGENETYDYPAVSTFTRWVNELPLTFKRTKTTIAVSLRSFALAEDVNTYLIAKCAGLPLRLDEDEARRDLWLDDRPGAVWDSLRWAAQSGELFNFKHSYDNACWLITLTNKGHRAA